MDRNLPVLLARQGITFFVRGVGFALIMVIATLYAVMRGVWEQSDTIARAWQNQIRDLRGHGGFEVPFYWLIRIIALLLMLVILVAFSRLVYWIFDL